jgi:hypothetical protein
LYNRYVPDENGTFRRTIVEDAPPPPPEPLPSLPPEPAPLLRGGLSALFGGKLDLGDLMLLAILVLMMNDCEQSELAPLMILAFVYLTSA